MRILVSLVSGANNIERDIMRKFYEGVLNYYTTKTGFVRDGKKNVEWLMKKNGMGLELSYDIEPKACDIAVQFGTTKPRSNEHHVVRQNLAQAAQHIVYVETPLLGRKIVDRSEHDFFRVGVDGFLNQDAVFVPENAALDPARLDLLQQLLGIQFPGWKNHNEGDILILTQLVGDASLRGQNHGEWLSDTVRTIRKITNRPIVIRVHPSLSEKGRQDFFADLHGMIMANYENITWSDGAEVPLDQDFARAGITVSYSSGSTIDSVLAGVPCITVDQGNMAYNISEHLIENIENPYVVSNELVQDWLLTLCYSQWNSQEIVNGTAWQHLVTIFQEKGIDLDLKLPHELDQGNQ